MITTTAISHQTGPIPQQRGKAGAGPGTGPRQDFAAALRGLTYSSLAAAITVQNSQVPDFARTDAADAPVRGYDSGRPAPFRDDASLAPPRTEQNAEPAESADAPVQTDLRENGDAAGGATAFGSERQSDTATQPEEGPVSTAAPAPQADAAPRSGPHGAERIAQAANALSQSGTPETQSPTTQQTAQQGPQNGANADGRALRASVTDPAANDQLPQLAHTLSSRAAVVAQAESAKPAPGAETGAKNGPVDPSASSLFASASQSASQAGQQAKGRTLKNANGGPQNAAQGQGVQPGTQQVQAQAVQPVQPQLQQNFAGTQSGTGGAANTIGQQSFAARSELAPMAGAGQAAPQFNLRNAGGAQVPKAPPPVPARFVANQVAVQIQKTLGQGGDRINIQLKPAELGRVEVRLDIGSDGRVAAVITADRPDTLDLLQRDARILQNSLQNAGLQADGNSLSFELKGHNQAFGDNGKNAGTAGSAGFESDGSAEVLSSTARPGIISDTRVDIQV